MAGGERGPRQGEWGEEQRRKPVSHIYHLPSNSCNTFFFLNFPSTHGEYDMLKFFQR